MLVVGGKQKMVGTEYISSNKFSLIRTVICTCIGVSISILIGFIYGFVCYLNPIIYLNSLVLIGVCYTLIFLMASINLFTQSRNKIINIVVTLIVCAFAWYAHWCYYFKQSSSMEFKSILLNPIEVLNYIGAYINENHVAFGRASSNFRLDISGFLLKLIYFIEFLLFFIPIYFVVKTKTYYCENCKEFYSSETLYTNSFDLFFERFDENDWGNFEFICDFNYEKDYKKLNSNPHKNRYIVKIDHYFCNRKCNLNSILNISTHELKYYDSEQKIKLEQIRFMVEDTYISNKTSFELRQLSNKI